jgi:hypothetical protein
MIYYIIFILCGLGFYFSFKEDKNISYILIAILGAFLSTGYMCGTDWPVYEQMYNMAEKFNPDLFRKEKGYLLYMLLFRSLNIDFWYFVIINKIVVFVILINFIKNFEINKSGFLLLFLSEIGFMLFIDNPLRNFIAFGLGLITFSCLFQKKNVLFFIFAFVAFSFHFSAIILLVLFFVRNIKFSTSTVLTFFILSYFVFATIDFSFLQSILPEKIFNERLRGYLRNDKFIQDAFTIGFVFRTVTLIFILYFRDKVISGKFGLIVFNGSIIFFLVYPISISFVIVQRLQYYTFPLVFISILYIIRELESRRLLRDITKLILILYSFIKLDSTLTLDSRYIPYSNYLYYEITDKHPDFESRTKHNERNSPYKKPDSSW